MTVKDSVLEALQASRDDFLSGESLSATLDVSRAAVWKAIKKLREEGYPIEAVTNKGYMLMSESWLITEESLRLSLPARYRNNEIHLYDTTDSTNLRAKQFALENAPHGTIVMARQQTAGRGRLGRSFFSPLEGIYLSLIIRKPLDISHALLITSAAAVSVADSLDRICGVDAGIKWVNDIYVDGKKVCGIGTEAISNFETGQIESLVIGIGINTNLRDFPRELLDVAGAVEGNYSKSALAGEIIAETLDLIDEVTETALSETSEEPAFMERYREKSIVIGRNIKVYKGGYRKDISDESGGIPARVLGISGSGGLKVMYPDGSRETLSTGEISIRFE